MADKTQIIRKIQENLFLTKENKKRLLGIIDLITAEELQKLEKLLDQEIDILKKIINKIIDTELKSDHAESFMLEMRKLLKDTKLSTMKIKEKGEREEEERKAKKLLKAMT